MEYPLQGKDFDGLYFLLNIRKFGSVNAFINSIDPKSKQNSVQADLSRSVKQLEHLLGVSLRTRSKPQTLTDKGLMIADELSRVENLLSFFKRDNLNKVIFFGTKSYTDIFVTPLVATLFKQHKISSNVRNGNSDDTINAIKDASAEIFLIKKSAFERISIFEQKKFFIRPLKRFSYQWAIPNGKSLSDITSGRLPAAGLSLNSDTMSFINKRLKNIQWSAFFPYFKDVCDYAQEVQCSAVIPSYFSCLFKNYTFHNIQGSHAEQVLLVSFRHIYNGSPNVKHSYDFIFSQS